MKYTLADADEVLIRIHWWEEGVSHFDDLFPADLADRAFGSPPELWTGISRAKILLDPEQWK